MKSKKENIPFTQAETVPLKESDITACGVSGSSKKEIVVNIPGYQILEKIGEGGMGSVYKAKQENLGRIVAIKILKPELAVDSDFTARFLREAKTAAAVSHSNVIHIYEVGEVNGLFYMALEYVSGGDLAGLIMRRGGLSEHKALSMMKGCIEGLKAIEGAGLIHRDIKPANIFLGENDSVHIGDLGLARHTTLDDKLTVTGMAMGTPSYMSPEHIQAVSDIDIRSDIYAFGATLYKMLTADEPFHGDSVYTITHEVLSTPTPDPRALNPSLSNTVNAILFKAMQKDREDRYQNCSQFLQDIEASLKGKPLLYAKGGFGIIKGIPKEDLTLDKDKISKQIFPNSSKSTVAPVGCLPSRSVMMMVAIVILGSWLFVFLPKLLTVDKTKYKPKWAEETGRDKYGYWASVGINNESLKFRYIKPGTFLMGSPITESGRFEKEVQKEKKVEAFWMLEHEFSQHFIEAMKIDNPSNFFGKDQPVEKITYKNVDSIVSLLSKEKGISFSLPTEEQWEYAARAGNKESIYKDLVNKAYCSPPVLRLAWEKAYKDKELTEEGIDDFVFSVYKENKKTISCRTMNVKSKLPNGFGLFDMIGNVSEWCNTKGAAPSTRIVKGGSWYDHPRNCRFASSVEVAEDYSDFTIGFRLIIKITYKNNKEKKEK